MLTELTIKIVTGQGSEAAEEDLRNAIRKAGYDISDLVVQELDNPAD